jgi:hypothetical protein
MSNKVYQSIQENVIDYFKDVDDKTFIAVVDTIAYHQPIGQNEKAAELIDSFLKDNGLEQVYASYLIDFQSMAKGESISFFRRTSMSETHMIENIKTALISAGYNRFRNSANKRDANKKAATKYKKIMEAVDKLMDAGSPERFDEGMDEMREFYFDENRARHKTR